MSEPTVDELMDRINDLCYRPSVEVYADPHWHAEEWNVYVNWGDESRGWVDATKPTLREALSECVRKIEAAA